MATVAHSSLIEAFDAVVAGSQDVDRHAVFADLRAELPVFRSDALGAWVCSRYDDARAVLEDSAASSRSRRAPERVSSEAASSTGAAASTTRRRHRRPPPAKPARAPGGGVGKVVAIATGWPASSRSASRSTCTSGTRCGCRCS